MNLQNVWPFLISIYAAFNYVPAFAFLLEHLFEHEVHHLCHQIAVLDCETMYSTQEYEVTCGTDEVTYKNFCVYAQAKCKNKDLMIKNIGICQANTGSSISSIDPSVSVNPTEHAITTAAVSAVTTEDVIVKVFCLNADTYSCPNGLNPVCGSDGNFYLNNCEFAKAVCENRHLARQALDNCKSPSTPIPLTSKLTTLRPEVTSTKSSLDLGSSPISTRRIKG